MNIAITKKGRIILAGIIVLCVTAIMSSTVLAEVSAPVITKILSAATGKSPSRIALGPDGSVYVLDRSDRGNKLMMYGSAGNLRGAVSLAGSPLSVAVSPDNIVHVGMSTAGVGSVDLYSPSGTMVGRLNGFNEPVAIAFAAGSGMLVADGNSLIAAGGQVISSFVKINAVAVNEALDQLYVQDMGGLAVVNGYSSTPVSRVQVFKLSNLGAGPIASFGMVVEGVQCSAITMAVDAAGRVYLADNNRNIVGIFDSAGMGVGKMFGSADTRNPLSIAIDAASGRLAVLSGLGMSYSLFGIDSYALLSADPTHLSIQYQAAAGDLPVNVALTNAGTSAASWSAVSNVPWLTLSPAAGDVAAGGNMSFAAIVSAAQASGFAAGSMHTGAISVSYNGGKLTIPVTLAVTANPSLSVEPSVLNITKRISDTGISADVAVIINNDATGGYAISAQSNSDWLSVVQKTVSTDLANRTTTQVNGIALTADAKSPINSTAGVYNGQITFTAAGQTSVLTVNLTVVSTGKISVTTDNKDATFTVTGPDKSVHTGQGLSFSVDATAAGEYTVVYGAVSGFKTPAVQKKTLAAGGDLAFNGHYADLRAKMNIIASHGNGPKETSDVAVFTADGTLQLMFSAFPHKFGANTAAGDIDGDGIAEIIVGSGGGNKVPAAVKGFRRDGSLVSGAAFNAYDKLTGVIVASGDFDGNGVDEIVTGSMGGAAIIRVFSYDAVSAAVTDAGVHIDAYPGLSAGVNISVADVDGDGIPEIVTIPRTGNSGLMAKVYRVDASAGMGSWSVSAAGQFPVCQTSGVTASAAMLMADGTPNLAAADITGDGRAEILVSCGTEIKVYAADGRLVRSLATGSGRPEFIAAGDLTYDGVADIVLGDAQGNNMKTVRVLGQPGITFNAFKSSYGVKVSVGNLGLGN